MDSFSNSIGFVSQFGRLCCSPTSVSPFVFGSLGLKGRLFIAHLLVLRGKRTPLPIPFYMAYSTKSMADGINRIAVSGIGINKTGRDTKPSPKCKFMSFFFVFSKKIRNFAPDLQTVS